MNLMRRTRRFHRIMGTLLILPFFGWAATGLLFFIKPGYGAAYASLQVKTYPLEEQALPALEPNWLEVRLVRTVLGTHLLTRDPNGRQHRHLDGALWQPTQAQVNKLLTDAMDGDSRYGRITQSNLNGCTTDTGVTVALDWSRLSLYQKGLDTRRIDLAYKIHYLQWTGQKTLDQVLGMAGLLFLVLLALSGARLLLARD